MDNSTRSIADLALITPSIEYSYEKSAQLSLTSKTPTEIITMYVNSQPRDYIEELSAFSKRNDKNPPKNRKAFLFVPAYNETNNLAALAEHYLNQYDFDGCRLPITAYEVCFVINYPASNQNSKDTYTFIEAIRVIETLRQNGAMNIHLIAKAFPPSLACLGRSRKYGLDYALLRLSQQGGNQIEDTCIISNEGDTLDVPSTYIASFIRHFRRHPGKFVQGRVCYPRELTEKYEPIRIFVDARESVHLGMGIHRRTFSHYGGILPVGRNFAVSPIIAARVGGIDPVRRIDTDDDINFGVDISRLLGPEVKMVAPIPLVTNPRREVHIVANLLNGGNNNSGISYSRFHENMGLYSLTWDDVLSIADEQIPTMLDKRKSTALLDHYYNWVLRSVAMSRLDNFQKFQDIMNDYHTHKISYWEKEKWIFEAEMEYVKSLPSHERDDVEHEIAIDALSWFNHFVSSCGRQFEIDFNGLESKLGREV